MLVIGRCPSTQAAGVDESPWDSRHHRRELRAQSPEPKVASNGRLRSAGSYATPWPCNLSGQANIATAFADIAKIADDYRLPVPAITITTTTRDGIILARSSRGTQNRVRELASFPGCYQ